MQKIPSIQQCKKSCSKHDKKDCVFYTFRKQKAHIPL
ncbi:hypothetical protein [Bacillus rhizoplanae]